MDTTKPASTSASRPALGRIFTTSPLKSAEEIAEIYNSGKFAQPASQRDFFSRREVYTEQHKNLVSSLRDECQSLYASAMHLKQRVARADEKALRAQADAAETKQAMHNHQAAFQMLRVELEDANRSISEMDEMMQQTRNRRIHRMSQILAEDPSQAVALKD